MVVWSATYCLYNSLAHPQKNWCALQTAVPEQRVNIKDFQVENRDWLFPETTKNFSKLPLQYKVFHCQAVAQFFSCR